jgi:hypothetical protein
MKFTQNFCALPQFSRILELILWFVFTFYIFKLFISLGEGGGVPRVMVAVRLVRTFTMVFSRSE